MSGVDVNVTLAGGALDGWIDTKQRHLQRAQTSLAVCVFLDIVTNLCLYESVHGWSLPSPSLQWDFKGDALDVVVLAVARAVVLALLIAVTHACSRGPQKTFEASAKDDEDENDGDVYTTLSSSSLDASDNNTSVNGGGGGASKSLNGGSINADSASAAAATASLTDTERMYARDLKRVAGINARVKKQANVENATTPEQMRQRWLRAAAFFFCTIFQVGNASLIVFFILFVFVLLLLVKSLTMLTFINRLCVFFASLQVYAGVKCVLFDFKQTSIRSEVVSGLLLGANLIWINIELWLAERVFKVRRARETKQRAN
jgi:hypothetical protein